MGLALDFLLTIFIELPIIAFFFKKSKRQTAVIMALAINMVSWSISHILIISTELNPFFVAIGLTIAEAAAFSRWLPCKLKKAFALSLIVNCLSFAALRYNPIDFYYFQSNADQYPVENQ